MEGGSREMKAEVCFQIEAKSPVGGLTGHGSNEDLCLAWACFEKPLLSRTLPVFRETAAPTLPIYLNASIPSRPTLCIVNLFWIPPRPAQPSIPGPPQHPCPLQSDLLAFPTQVDRSHAGQCQKGGGVCSHRLSQRGSRGVYSIALCAHVNWVPAGVHACLYACTHVWMCLPLQAAEGSEEGHLLGAFSTLAPHHPSVPQLAVPFQGIVAAASTPFPVHTPH